jgi:predicted aspartyl protease
VHVSDDRAEVPAGATVTVQPTRVRPKTAAPASPASPASPAPAASRPVLAVQPTEKSGVGTVHVLRFPRASHEISLNVTLDERARCEFKVDTGASLNTVPAWVVRELGIEIGSDTPRISLVGISGKPALVPVIVMPSVHVGDAVVANGRDGGARHHERGPACYDFLQSL